MPTHKSSIDDLLMGMGQAQPEISAPEIEASTEEGEISSSSSETPVLYEDTANTKEESSTADEDFEEPQEGAETGETDDYGNPKEAARTYTEEEVNERINKAVRDRLSRERSSTQPTQSQAQQAAASGFEYDDGSNESWQQQLEAFVEQTLSKVSEKQRLQQSQLREQQLQAEFEAKFDQGMSKFNDFTEVVKTESLTPAMVIATRAMNNPAAFLYAASKRHPEELKRISSTQDPYRQMVEIGKLEERMRKTKTATSAPRPLGRTKEDASLPTKASTKKEASGDDLIASSEARRLAALRNKRGR